MTEESDPTKELRETVEACFPSANIWHALDLALSAWAELSIKDITLPCALFLVDVPSSHKTTIVKILKSTEEEAYYLDDFTPAGFVSHAVGLTEEKLQKVDLLPKLKDKLFLIPEMASIWNASKDHLVRNVGYMTRVLDGDGLTRQSGVHGKRGYDEPIMFVWVAATTPIPRKVWSLLGKLGSRLYFCPTNTHVDKNTLLKMLRGKEDYKTKIKKCRLAAVKLMVYLRKSPLTHEGKYEWNREADDEALLKKIICLADFLSRLRGFIEVSYDVEGNPESSMPLIEKPDRATEWLYNLARGHALLHGRRQINEEDVNVLTEVAMNSAPYRRVKAIEAIFKEDGVLTLQTFTNNLSCTKKTASNLAYTLKGLGLVNLYHDRDAVKETGGRPPLLINLKSEYGEVLLQWYVR